MPAHDWRIEECADAASCRPRGQQPKMVHSRQRVVALSGCRGETRAGLGDHQVRAPGDRDQLRVKGHVVRMQLVQKPGARTHLGNRLAHAAQHQRAQPSQRCAAVGRAQCHDSPQPRPAREPLEQIARDQSAHGVADEVGELEVRVLAELVDALRSRVSAGGEILEAGADPDLDHLTPVTLFEKAAERGHHARRGAEPVDDEDRTSSSGAPGERARVAGYRRTHRSTSSPPLLPLSSAFGTRISTPGR